MKRSTGPSSPEFGISEGWVVQVGEEEKLLKG